MLRLIPGVPVVLDSSSAQHAASYGEGKAFVVAVNKPLDS